MWSLLACYCLTDFSCFIGCCYFALVIDLFDYFGQFGCLLWFAYLLAWVLWLRIWFARFFTVWMCLRFNVVDLCLWCILNLCFCLLLWVWLRCYLLYLLNFDFVWVVWSYFDLVLIVLFYSRWFVCFVICILILAYYLWWFLLVVGIYLWDLLFDCGCLSCLFL